VRAALSTRAVTLARLRPRWRLRSWPCAAIGPGKTGVRVRRRRGHRRYGDRHSRGIRHP